jgi:hypothetical protein
MRRALTNWRAGCGKTACPVRREGWSSNLHPYPYNFFGNYSASRDWGRDEGLNLAPPSKPDRPVSGIRLSSQWVLFRDWIACARAMAKENSPSSTK